MKLSRLSSRKIGFIAALVLAFSLGGVGCSGDESDLDGNQNQNQANFDEEDLREDPDDTEEFDIEDEEDIEENQDVEDEDIEDGEDDENEENFKQIEGNICELAIDVTDRGFWEGESLAEMQNVYETNGGDNCPVMPVSGKDRVYKVIPEETTTYRVRVAPHSDGFNPFIYVRTDCGANACLAGTRLNGPGVAETVTFEAEGGVETFIIVDNEPEGWGNDFGYDLSVETVGGDGGDDCDDGGDDCDDDGGDDDICDDVDGCDPLPGAGTCEDAIDVTGGGLWKYESMEGMTNSHSPSGNNGCPNERFSKEDRVYVVTPEVKTVYEVKVTAVDSGFEPVIYVQAECGGAACLAGTGKLSPASPKSLEFEAEAGEPTFIFVDTTMNSSGNLFELEITIVEEIDDDGDGDGGDGDGGDGDGGDGDGNGDGGELRGDTCEDAIDVTAGGVWEDESMAGMTDQYDAGTDNSCPFLKFSWRDKVYAVTPETATTYTIRVEPHRPQFDPLIYVRSDCSASTCIDGTRAMGPGQVETLTFDAPGGETSFIIVDTEAGDSEENTFDLTVTIE